MTRMGRSARSLFGFSRNNAAAASMAALMALAGAGTAAAEAFTVSYDGPPVAIPDNLDTGVTIALPVSGITGFIRDMELSFDGSGPCSTGLTENPGNIGLVHPWLGDLTMTLTGPSGRTIQIFSRPNNGTGGANLCHTIFDDQATVPFQTAGPANAPFTGAFKPRDSFSVYNELSPNGTWLLTISDRVADDSGTLHRFSLYFETDPVASANTAPVVSITAPSQDAITNASPYKLSGTSEDFDGTVSRVEFRVLPSTTWLMATNDSGDWAQWSADASLTNGANTVEVRAVDDKNKKSAAASRVIDFDSGLNPPPTITVDEPEHDLIIDSSVNSFTWSGTATDPNNEIVRVQFRALASSDPDQTFDVTSMTSTGPNSVKWEFTMDTSSIPTISDENLLTFSAVDIDGAVSAEVRRDVRRRSGENIPPTVDILDPDSDRIVSVTETSYVFIGTATDPDGTVQNLQYRTTTGELSDKRRAGGEKRVVGDWTDIPYSGPAPTVDWSFYAPLQAGYNLIEVRAVDFLTPGPATGRVITVANSDLGAPVVDFSSPTGDTTVPGSQSSITIRGSANGGADDIARVLFRVNASAFAPANLVGNSPGPVRQWNFATSLLFGDNVIEVKAIDSTGQESALAKIVVTRGDDTRVAPVIFIDDPATDITVDNSEAIYVVVGRAVDSDSPVEKVEYRAASTLAGLQSATWNLAVNDTGDWFQWSVALNLNTFANIIEVRATDTTGVTGNSRRRVITRRSATPTVNITSPATDRNVFGDVTSLDISGTAADADGTINLVRFRVGLETTLNAPWQNADPVGGNFGNWRFNTPLETGRNLIEVQAFDNDDEESPIAQRYVTRLKAMAASDLCVLTSFTDIWGSNNNAGVFEPPSRFAYIGFHHEPATGWLTFAADFNGDGLSDFGTLTEFGDVWITMNGGGRTLEPPFRNSDGWRHNDANNQTALVGDFDGNGLADMVQIEKSGELKLSLNTTGRLDSPVSLGGSAIRYEPSTGKKVFAGDFNGDGRDDILQLDNVTGNIFVATSTGVTFNARTRWLRESGLRYDESQRSGIHVGDFNGDGLDDVVQIKDGTTLVAVSVPAEDRFLAPVTWGNLGFNDDPGAGNGWWVFAMDVNGNGVDDLVQLTQFGEIWVGITDGTQFGAPTKIATLGFEHKPAGPWQVYPTSIE